jgi:hypothetical protein
MRTLKTYLPRALPSTQPSRLNTTTETILMENSPRELRKTEL